MDYNFNTKLPGGGNKRHHSFIDELLDEARNEYGYIEKEGKNLLSKGMNTISDMALSVSQKIDMIEHALDDHSFGMGSTGLHLMFPESMIGEAVIKMMSEAHTGKKFNKDNLQSIAEAMISKFVLNSGQEKVMGLTEKELNDPKVMKRLLKTKTGKMIIDKIKKVQPLFHH